MPSEEEWLEAALAGDNAADPWCNDPAVGVRKMTERLKLLAARPTSLAVARAIAQIEERLAHYQSLVDQRN